MQQRPRGAASVARSPSRCAARCATFSFATLQLSAHARTLPAYTSSGREDLVVTEDRGLTWYNRQRRHPRRTARLLSGVRLQPLLGPSGPGLRLYLGGRARRPDRCQGCRPHLALGSRRLLRDPRRRSAPGRGLFAGPLSQDDVKGRPSPTEAPVAPESLDSDARSLRARALKLGEARPRPSLPLLWSRPSGCA